MAFSRRLCVAGLLPYAPGEKVHSVFGDNSLRWLFDPQEKSSVISFWRDSTGGIVDLSADVFEWRAVENAAVLHAMTTGSDRSARAQAGCDVLVDNGLPLAGYDVFVLVVGGRKVDGGGCMVRVDDRWMNAVLMDDYGWHNMFCHEVGHALGFDHNYWQAIQTDYMHGEYGDPYCVMGFSGVTNTSHTLPFQDRADIAATAELWPTAGCGVAATSLWRWLPGFPAIPPWAREIPRGGAVNVTLERAGSERGTRLAMMRTRANNGWWTVEYRPQVAWDRGMRPDRDEPAFRPGVVIHSVRDVGFVGEPGYPRSQYVCYEATIPVPSSGDEDWDNGEFAVRVLGSGSGAVQLQIGETLPNASAVRMDVVESWGPERREVGEDIELKLSGPACGTNTYASEMVFNTYLVQVAAAASGFQRPSFQFAVNGVAAGAPAAIHGPPAGGQVTFAADVEVPTGYRSWRSERRDVTATYETRGNRLGLILPEGIGKFPVTIGVTASDPGSPAPSAVAASTITATTAEVDLSPEAYEGLQACKSFLGHYVVVDPSIIKKPLDPIEHFHVVVPILFGDEGEKFDPEQLALTLHGLQQLQRVAPMIARREISVLAAKLGVEENQLRDTVEQLAPHG